MESTSKKAIILFVRHGERLDQIKKLSQKERQLRFPRCDPPLSTHGKKLAT